MCGIFSLSRCHFLTPVYFAVREDSSSLCPNTFLTSYQLTQSIDQDREKYNFAISWRLACSSNQTPNPKSTNPEFISLNLKFWPEQNIFFWDSKSKYNQSEIPTILMSYFLPKKAKCREWYCIVKNLEW